MKLFFLRYAVRITLQRYNMKLMETVISYIRQKLDNAYYKIHSRIIGTSFLTNLVSTQLVIF